MKIRTVEINYPSNLRGLIIEKFIKTFPYIEEIETSDQIVNIIAHVFYAVSDSNNNTVDFWMKIRKWKHYSFIFQKDMYVFYVDAIQRKTGVVNNYKENDEDYFFQPEEEYKVDDSKEQIKKDQIAAENPPCFKEELASLMNRRSMESTSNTPDYILAQFLTSCLKAFEASIQDREVWHGRKTKPAHARYGREIKDSVNGLLLCSKCENQLQAGIYSEEYGFLKVFPCRHCNPEDTQ